MTQTSIYPPRPRHRGRRLLAGALGLAAGVACLTAAPASAYSAGVRVDLRVLVVNDGSAGVDTIVAQLDREGVPYDTISSGVHTTITAATLSDVVGGVTRGKYQGIVLPNEQMGQPGLTAAEMTVIANYEKQFKVRQVDAYTWAGGNVGLTSAYGGKLDGTTATVTATGRTAGFGYLNGAVTIDNRYPTVDETYAYLGTPTPKAGTTFTPLVTGASGAITGSLLGVYTHDTREELVVTLAMNRYLTIGMVLGHGIVTWLTQGTHLGYWRNSFSMHIDDVLMPDATWSTTGNCTVGDDCPSTVTGADVRMTATDVDYLRTWQQTNGLKLDMVFNGAGSVDAGTSDTLTSQFMAYKGDFRWINHTYEHMFLGCVQDFSTNPWRCVTANGAVSYVSAAVITSQISQNVTWARSKGIAINANELVTGEHSGLITAPQMTMDNPNLATALKTTGITLIASDASREALPRVVAGTTTRTAPRHPMNVYYNTSTRAAAADEYNWIYTSKANGGSGICEGSTVSTCITPLSTTTGWTSYIVPMETTIAFDHIVSGDLDPHFAHQSNLTKDRILYDVLKSIITRYKATFTTATPMVNPTFAQVNASRIQQEKWRAAVKSKQVTAYVKDGVVTVLNSGAAVDVPITVPAGTRTGTIAGSGAIFGSVYGTEQSTWKYLSTGGQQQLRLPA